MLVYCLEAPSDCLARCLACVYNGRFVRLATPSRHERGGFDSVTDNNKQVTHDP